MKNKVTLLICCYNGEKYVKTCFECILAQTYTNIELIIANDGSTDNSLNEINKYHQAFKDKGIELKVYSQENQGAGFAASLGLRYATGDYISCLDIDDYLYPTSIEKRVDFLVNHPDYSIVRTNGYEENQKSRKLFVTNQAEKEEVYIFNSLLFGRTNNWAGSYMIKSEVLWKIYPTHIIPGSRYGQNLQLLLAASYNNKSGFIDEPLMIYYRNLESFTGKVKTIEENIQLLDGFKNIRMQIIENLNINKTEIENKLSIFYAKRKMQLGVDYNNKSIFIKHFLYLKANNSISNIDFYYYHHFNNNRLRAFYYRLMHFFKH